MSEIHTTVDVQKPDVRFGKPDEKASGYRIVRISDVRELTMSPDFRHIEFLLCLKSGRNVRISDKLAENRTLCPVFRRLLLFLNFKRLKTGQNVRFSDVQFEIVRFPFFRALEPDV